MTHYLFRQLSYERQLHVVLTQGCYLTYRLEATIPVMLHYVADGGRGFFVELGVDESHSHFFVRRSFHDMGLLTAYVQGVWLPA